MSFSGNPLGAISELETTFAIAEMVQDVLVKKAKPADALSFVKTAARSTPSRATPARSCNACPLSHLREGGERRPTLCDGAAPERPAEAERVRHESSLCHVGNGQSGHHRDIEAVIPGPESLRRDHARCVPMYPPPRPRFRRAQNAARALLPSRWRVVAQWAPLPIGDARRLRLSPLPAAD